MAQPRDFGFGADESLLRDQARKFLRQNASVEKLRTMLTKDHEAVYERGERPRWDEDVWAKLVELGWPALAVPEDAGGVGAKMVGLVALVEEVGRVALPSPLLSTFSACFVLREADTDVAKRALGAIADGGTATLAISDRHGSPDVGRPTSRRRSTVIRTCSRARRRSCRTRRRRPSSWSPRGTVTTS
jgi:alkylation response protein AidB-like acyl-CoA dehydrogenase